MTPTAGAKITKVMGMPLPFTDAEYTDRNDRLRERIAGAELDALLMFHQESMFYLFGYDQLGYWVYQTAIIAPESRDISVLCRTVDHDMIVDLPNVRDVRTWKDDENLNPGQLTLDWLSQLGHLKRGARIGIEMHSHALLPFYYETIKSAMPEGATLVDASHLVTDLRVHKSDAEVAYMREAGKVMDAAYAGAFEAFREGALETEILGSGMAEMFAAGGHVPAIVPPLSSGPRTMSKTHGAAVDRAVRPNEPLTFEPGSSRHRYHAVGVQTRWLGTPPKRVQETYDGLLGALDAARDIIKPGLPVSQLAEEINRALDRVDLLIPDSHHGYGIGIGYPPTWLDNLRIKLNDPQTLERNMTFFLLGHYTVEGATDLPVELFVGEPILVTGDGCERLSKTPLALN